MRQIFGWLRWPVNWERKAFVFTTASIVLVVTGPFGTYEALAFWERMVFWLVVMGGVGFFMHVAMRITLSANWLAPLGRIPRLALGAFAAGLPGAAVVVFVYMVFLPPPIAAETLPLIWLQVSLIGFPIGLVEFHKSPPANPAKDLPASVRLFRRLPDALGSDIVSLSMQDHYVEVTTTRGRTMILMRMADAIDEVDGLEGVRIHRSHWVARAHVKRTQRAGHRRYVELSDGRNLPLSETYATALAST